MQLQEVVDSLVGERRDLIEQRDNKLKQVTHLAEMVADLKLQLESMVQQDQYKTQLYGIAITILHSLVSSYTSEAITV